MTLACVVVVRNLSSAAENNRLHQQHRAVDVNILIYYFAFGIS